MTDQVEQSAAEPSNSEDAGSAAGALGLGKSDYLEPADFEPIGAGDGAIGSGEPEDQDEEIEIGDKKIAMPKFLAEKLKTERMMHADYTQKTQTVAEERRQIAAEREQVQRQAAEHQQYLNEHAEVVAINNQLAEYEKVNWPALIESDPQQAMILQQQQRALEAARQQKVGALTQKQQQYALEQQQQTAKLAQDAISYFAREIPGWNTEVENQLKEYVIGSGISAQALGPMVLHTPAIAKIAHKAMMYDALVKKQQATKQTQTQAPEAKPVVRVGSSAPVKKDPTSMTDAEFAAYRRKVSNRK